MKLTRGVLLALSLTAAAPAAWAQPVPSAPAGEVTGAARAVNADTMQVGTTFVFLFGVESMERNQLCFIDGQPWDCYVAAVRALETITGVGDVTCTLMGQPDYLGRWLGTCRVAGVDVAEELTRTGFAFAKRDETLDYVPAEEAAAAAHIGFWQGAFQMPAEHRAADGITVDRP